MKTLLIPALFAMFFQSTAQAEIHVNQAMNTKYYVKGIMELHASAMDVLINRELKKFDCLEGSLSLRTTKSPKTHIFGDDEPGYVKVGYQTKCFSPDIVAVNFSVGVFGYDEDYTDLTLKITTKTGVITKVACAYGLHNDLRKCPYDVNPEVFSSAAKEE